MDHRLGSPLSRRRFLGAAAGLGASAALWPALPASASASPARGPSSQPDPITEPYTPLHGGAFTGPAVPESDDPLVRFRWTDPTAADDLQVYSLTPVTATTETPAAFPGFATAATPNCAIRVVGTGSIRVDFGVESPAWLEFDSPDFSGAVELSISEYDDLARVNPGPANPIKTAAPQRYGNTYRLELNAELFEGVRFGWIQVTTFDQPWHITAIRAVCQAKPTNYNGGFDCDDPKITRIWYTGAYCVRAGFQADYMAPILMDRGDRYGWAGDCNPIQAAALVAFGDWDYIKANLDRTVDSTFGIETYSLYWVLSMLEYYQHTGDATTLRGYVTDMQGKLDHGNSIYADPSIAFYGWDERLGAGFEAPNRPETQNAYRMLFIRACLEFAQAMDTIGETALGQQYQGIAQQRSAELRADPNWYRSFGIHALAEAVNAGVVSAGQQQTVFEQGFADRLNRLSFSTFNQYFILQALSALDRYDEALVTLRDNWGGQIDYGGTTYFEVFRPDWLTFLGPNDPIPNSQSGWTSLCHPWGGGASAWLTHEVLGIRPTAPGYATVDITPQLGTTLTRVSGFVPTPNGRISASFDAAAGHGTASIPGGTVARIGIPSGGRTISRVRVNGTVVWDGSFHPVTGIGGASSADGSVLLTGVAAGQYIFAVDYQGSRKPYVAPPLRHPLPPPTQDTRTGGDWGGRYGRDGYVLFNYDGPGTNRQSLPAYVSSVTPWTGSWSGALSTVWQSGTTDRRAPAPDRGNGLPRNAACLYTGTPQAGGMTMPIDIAVTPGTRYQLALYLVDWDNTNRRMAVELFDLDTRDLLAQEALINEFHDGAYLVFQCDRSVRIRCAQIRGDNAVLSGLFFD